MIIEILLITAFACILIHVFNGKKQEGNLPPGPWGLPILGHFLFLSKNPAKKFLEWKQIYGPIFSIKLGNIPVVVLNDTKLIKEAFSLPVLSGRAQLKNWEKVGDPKGILLHDGPRQEEQRRFAIKTLKDFGMAKSNVEFRIQDEIVIFLNNLKKKNDEAKGKPMQVKYLFRFPVINSLWVAVMGKRFDETDPIPLYLLEQIERAADMKNFSTVISWYFPIWATFLCFMGINRVVNGWRSIHSTIAKLIEETREDYVPNVPKHFTHAYFDQIAKTADPNSSFHKSDHAQSVTTSEIFVGAIDTTTTTLDWLLIYMVREPQVQQKLQEEIDSVIGSPINSVPSLAHKPLMPYTEALIQELLRISSLAPLGVFHRNYQTFDFHGYTIPKNTVFIANQYGAHQDPEVWEEPEKFIPERFLEKGKGNNLTKKMNAYLVPFSYGKRVCPGEAIARDQLFLFITSFFQRFTVSSTGKLPSLEGNFGVVWNPNPFEVILAEREA